MNLSKNENTLYGLSAYRVFLFRFIERVNGFLRILADIIITTIMGYRFEPVVSHLQSLKEGVWNLIPMPSISHLIRFPIIVAMKSARFFGIHTQSIKPKMFFDFT